MDKRGLCDSHCQEKKVFKTDSLICCSGGTAHTANGTMREHPTFNHMGPDKEESKMILPSTQDKLLTI